MKTVRDILAVKGREVWTIELEATVFDAMKRMAEKEVGALLVADGPKLVGIISGTNQQQPQFALSHKAAISKRLSDVRFTLESGH